MFLANTPSNMTVSVSDSEYKEICEKYGGTPENPVRFSLNYDSDCGAVIMHPHGRYLFSRNAAGKSIRWFVKDPHGKRPPEQFGSSHCSKVFYESDFIKIQLPNRSERRPVSMKGQGRRNKKKMTDSSDQMAELRRLIDEIHREALRLEALGIHVEVASPIVTYKRMITESL